MRLQYSWGKTIIRRVGQGDWMDHMATLTFPGLPYHCGPLMSIPKGQNIFFEKKMWVRDFLPLESWFFCQRWTIVTDANITHTPTSTAIQHSIDGLVALQQTIAQTEEMFHPNDVDLVLDIVPDESGRVVCEYYLAYHPTRVIFWLESVTPSQSLVFKMKGVHSETHIGNVVDPHFVLITKCHPSVCGGRPILVW